jgi:4-hydroxybenzoate polyprenyltransferase
MRETAKTVLLYLKICRVSNLPTVWTNVLCAILLSASIFAWQPFLLLAMSMSFFYAAGMCLNDVCDAEVDKVKKPFRPIPAGAISKQSALVFTGIMLLAAFSLLLFVPNPKAGSAGIALLLFIVLYDLSHKQQAASVFLMAACRLMVFVVSAIAVAGEIRIAAAAAGFGQFVYILIISIIARHEKSRAVEFSFPVIPVMIAAIALLDGLMLAAFVSPFWLAAGIAGMLLTLFGQRFVKGD